MKFTGFEKLRLIVDELGAPPVIANLQKLLLGKGIPVNENIEQIVIGDNGIYFIEPSGVLTKVIIHIVDKNVNSRYAKGIRDHVMNNEFDSPELIKDLHKFHLIKCTTIEKAENEGWRKEKYRMSRKQDGGFHYRFVEDNAVIAERDTQKLLVCKNCLRVINPLLDKSYTPSDFDLSKFLSSDMKIVNHLSKEGDYSDVCAPNIYQSDWKEISRKYRALKNYHCENTDCPAPDLSVSKFHRYLHTHHVSFDKSNNNYSNLKAMCVYCHANQPNHGQMKKTPDYIEYKRLRSLP